jgi:hypothetical protein
MRVPADVRGTAFASLMSAMNALWTTIAVCGLLGQIDPPETPAEPTAAPQTRPAPDETVAVELASGRTLTGLIDARTDAALLWLRWERGAAAMTRPIEWDRVVKARVAGQELSGTEFQRIVKAIRRDVPPPAKSTAVGNTIIIKGTPNATEAAAAPASTATSATPRVQSLAIETTVANWDAAPAVDGLLVRVYPLDAAGAVVPVDGLLEVELMGRSAGAAVQSQSFARLGSWSQPVRAAEIGVNGAVYRLPFQGVHPEYDTNIAPRGAVLARLSVPGQGTFQATASTVRIRPYSAVRDQLQQTTGQRFFDAEERNSP